MGHVLMKDQLLSYLPTPAMFDLCGRNLTGKNSEHSDHYLTSIDYTWCM